MLLGLVDIKPPDSARSIRLNLLSNRLRQLVEQRITIQFGEVPAFPRPALGLLFLPHFALSVLDFALLVIRGVHISFGDGVNDLLPCAVGFELILLLDRGNLQRRGFVEAGGVAIHHLAVFLATSPNREAFIPLPVDGVEGVFLMALFVQDGVKAVFLPGYPAFARVVYLRYVARGGDDMSLAVELDEWVAVNQAFNVQGWDGDEVVFVVSIQMKEGVAYLFDLDCARKGGFLSVVTL
jgi:hypothetical protein